MIGVCSGYIWVEIGEIEDNSSAIWWNFNDVIPKKRPRKAINGNL